MSSSIEPLDVARFGLEAYKTNVELNIKLMEAYANFNYRMMQVAELQVKVATTALQLAILRDAFESYRFARLQAMRAANQLEDKVDRFKIAIKRLNNLVLGETMNATFIGLGWQGFWFLQSQAPVATVLELAKVKCAAADRKGKHFYNPYQPTEDPEDAPSSIRNALLLMDWARKKTIVPRIGSPAQARMGELLEVLGTGAADVLTDTQTQLAAAQTELKRIREANWKQLDVKDESPKS